MFITPQDAVADSWIACNLATYSAAAAAPTASCRVKGYCTIIYDRAAFTTVDSTTVFLSSIPDYDTVGHCQAGVMGEDTGAPVCPVAAERAICQCRVTLPAVVHPAPTVR